MLGFKTFYNSRRVIIGIELAQKIHKRQFEIPIPWQSNPAVIWRHVVVPSSAVTVTVIVLAPSERFTVAVFGVLVSVLPAIATVAPCRSSGCRPDSACVLETIIPPSLSPRLSLRCPPAPLIGRVASTRGSNFDTNTRFKWVSFGCESTPGRWLIARCPAPAVYFSAFGQSCNTPKASFFNAFSHYQDW